MFVLVTGRVINRLNKVYAMHFRGLISKLAVWVGLASMLTACGGVSLWPFGDDDEAGARSRGPSGSTEYRCDKGRKFYVKVTEAGKTAWLVLPDREVLLNQAEVGRYSNGITTLALEGEAATLDDGYKRDYNDCKANLPAKK